MILLLDTTVLVDVLRRRNNRSAQLASFAAAGNVLVVSTINVAEVYAGMRAGEEERTAALFADVDTFEVTSAIAVRGGMLKRNAASRGITISLQDSLIAATAIEMNIPLLTDNRKDFPFPELQLFNALG